VVWRILGFSVGESSLTMGVRRTIEKAVRCSFFEPDEGRLWKSAKRHGDILDVVKQEYEREGFSCQKELPVSGGKGSIDLLCIKGEETYIFEVKSTPYHRLSTSDLIQLAIYVYLYSVERNPGRFRAFLVYRGQGSKPFYVEFKDTEHLRVLGESFVENVGRQRNGSPGAFYIIGDLCVICTNTKCQFKAGMA
jgi:hypothetical protein